MLRASIDLSFSTAVSTNFFFSLYAIEVVEVVFFYLAATKHGLKTIWIITAKISKSSSFKWSFFFGKTFKLTTKFNHITFLQRAI